MQFFNNLYKNKKELAKYCLLSKMKALNDCGCNQIGHIFSKGKPTGSHIIDSRYLVFLYTYHYVINSLLSMQPTYGRHIFHKSYVGL